MLHLTPWAKLGVLVASFIIVSSVAIFMVCFISPLCWLHQLLPESARLKYRNAGKKSKSNSIETGRPTEPVELTYLKQDNYHDYTNIKAQLAKQPPDLYALFSKSSILETTPSTPPPPYFPPQPYVPHGQTQYYQQQQGSPWALQKQVSATDSVLSGFSAGGSRPSSPVSSEQESSADSGSLPAIEKTAPYGLVHLSIQYTPLQESSELGTLQLKIVDVQDLPRGMYQASVSPFLRIFIQKKKRSFRRSTETYSLLGEFETMCHKKTSHPIFNETYEVQACKAELKDVQVRVVALEKDKYANPSALGECVIPLKPLHLTETPDAVCLTQDLNEPSENCGEILLELNYLPTAEKLSVTVCKANKLNCDRLPVPLDTLNICTTAVLLHNGKPVKRKRTKMCCGGVNPTWNETLAFDVPSQQLDNIVILVAVSAKEQSPNESELEGDNNGSGTPRHHQSHHKYIGKVALGPRVRSAGRQHWEAMLQQPRTQVGQTLILR